MLFLRLPSLLLLIDERVVAGAAEFVEGQKSGLNKTLVRSIASESGEWIEIVLTLLLCFMLP